MQSVDVTFARIGAWTTAKTLSWTGREYSGSYEGSLHTTNIGMELEQRIYLSNVKGYNDCINVLNNTKESNNGSTIRIQRCTGNKRFKS